MTGFLIVVALVAGLFAVRYLSRLAERGVIRAGTALGESLTPGGSPADPEPQGELVLSRPGTEVRLDLVDAGAVDPGDNRLTTPGGVDVKLSVQPGVARLACSWEDTNSEPTLILGDVLRAVRKVDGEAQVVLSH